MSMVKGVDPEKVTQKNEIYVCMKEKNAIWYI